jgi:tripartite-type tricarboxylate transporter receptor subunit TctC
LWRCPASALAAQFNFLRDIAPVAGITRVPNVMETNPNFPAKSVAEFIAYAKANPGKINMASSGNGTSVHLSGELFMAMTGIKMTHVPYRGANPALTDLIGGTVDVIFNNLPSSVEFLAVTLGAGSARPRFLRWAAKAVREQPYYIGAIATQG